MADSAPLRGYGPGSARYHRLHFDGDERKFELWYTKFMGYLKLRNLKYIVDGTPNPSTTTATTAGTGTDAGTGDDAPTPAATAAATTTAATDADKNAEVYAELIEFLDDRSLSLVFRDAPDDGKEALKILREYYMGKGKPRIITLWTELSLMSKGSESVTDYIIRAEKSASALRNAGENVSDSLLIAMVSKGLPNGYKSFEVVITQSHEIMSFSDFKVALRNFEDTENARIAREGDSVKHFRGRQGGGRHNNNGGGYQNNSGGGNHNSSGGGNHNNNGGGSQNDSGGQNSNGGRPTCHHCGLEGHKEATCNKKGKQWCKHCKTGSHSSKSCRSKNKNSRSSTNKMVEGGEHTFHFVMKVTECEDSVTDSPVTEDSESPVNADSTHSQVSDVECPALVEVEPCQSVLTTDVDTVVVHETPELVNVQSDPQDLDTILVQKELSNEQLKSDVVSSVADNPDDQSLVDSGATAHTVFDDSKFISVDESFKPQNHTIELADGSKTSGLATKRGTIEISLKNSGGEIVNGTLDGVLHVPSYPQNIFSVKAAIKKKSSVHFNSGEPSYLKSPSGMLFHFEEDKSGLYYLRDHSSPRALQNSVPSTIPSAKSDDDVFCVTRSIEEWHRVLGHCNRNDVLKLQNVVDGMKISGKNKFSCETCELGKMAQEICRKPDERAVKPLDFVHTDLSGAVEPVSIDGHKYTISFTDDYSGYVFTYFLKLKSDALKALNKFLADSAPCGTVKRMRCDNGGEFISQEFKDSLIKNKIKQEPSCPDSPHQNGTAERWWRTCFSMSRCLLLESGLPKSLWPYAVMYSTHVRNRCYQQRTGQTPYFLLTNKVPNISKLAIFGSTCYAFDHQNPKKLDPRSKKGVFVGMDKDSPAYLVYFPDDGKVRKYRTVKCTDEMYYPNPGKKQNVVIESDEDFDEFLEPQTPRRPEIHAVPPAARADDPQSVQAVVPIPDVPQIEVQDAAVQDAVVQEVAGAAAAPGDGGDVVNDRQNDAQLRGEERRYPPRVRRPPAHLRDYDTSSDEIVDQIHTNVDYCYTASTSTIPKSFKAAIASTESDKWKLAMDAEIDALNENKTYSLVPLPEGKTAVSGRWVYAVKKNLDGSDLFKARYVARGYTQVYGSDYFETFSPTAKMTSVRMLMQYAVQHDMVINQLDVKTAYLNAPIDCEIYMSQPEGYVTKGKENLVCRLHKSLYGLKQSGRNWNILLTDVLKKNEFVPSAGDPCLYISKSKDLILYWVDDILAVCQSHKKLNKIKNILKGKFKMKDLGVLKHFLGMRFEYADSKITIDQTLYLNSILSKYKMSDCKPRATPCELPGSNSVKSPTSDQNLDPKKFREIVGSLIYATTCTRPDLAWVVSRLSQNLANPRDVDWIMLKHVLRYVKGTASYKLCYQKCDGLLKLIGYSDSDWASSSEDRRSTSGYCFYLNTDSSPVSWKSKKQPTVALSSCEAEYMALGLSTQEALYLQRFTADFDLCTEPVLLYADNQGALDLVKNPVNHARTKHIDVKHHFVREKLVAGIVDYQFVRSDDNIADCFTKPLPKQKLQSFLPHLMIF